MKKIFLTLTASAIYLSSFAQCAVREVSLPQRSNASDLIIEGKVIAKNSFWNADHNMIYTANTIEIYKIFKGVETSGTIDILTEGGVVGNRMIKAEPSLNLSVDEIGVFTCETVKHFNVGSVSISSLPKYEAYASVQGFIKYNLNDQTAADVFRTYSSIQNEVYPAVLSPSFQTYQIIKQFDPSSLSSSSSNKNQTVQTGLSISSFSPSTITAGTASILTINGSGFGATRGTSFISFKNADDGGSTEIQPVASQYIAWGTSQIQVSVPTNAGTGLIRVTVVGNAQSITPLTVTYAQLNVNSGGVIYQPDHINQNTTGGYTWHMNTAFDADASARPSFMRAFDNWRCNTGMNWIIGTTTATNSATLNSENVICFDNTAPLSAGILGVCYSYWSGCGSPLNWWVDELDIIFDDGSNLTSLGCTWQFGPGNPSGTEYDFESVAVHELGHGRQLGHVIDNPAIMNFSIANGVTKRVLSANDLAGAADIQTQSTTANACGPGPMTNYSCGTPPVANFSGSPLSICPGSSVNFSDLSTGVPTSWAWTFTGGTPSSSTSQNPSIVYNTSGTYAVSLTATNSSGNDTKTVNGYITVYASPGGSASITNVTCNGGTNGAIDLTPSGGQSPYTFLWNPSGQTTEDRNSLAASTYSVTITDAHGCTKTLPFTVTQPTVLSASMSMTSSTCPNNDGTAKATPSGGTSPYTYVWSPGGQTTQTATGLSAATYSCNVQDNNGCTTSGSIAVTTTGCGTPPVANFSGTPLSLCVGGSVSFTDLSLNVPTSWAWTFTGGTPSSSTSQNPNIVYNTAGTYAVSLTATNSSGNDTKTVNGYITVNANPSASAVVTNVTCNGSGNGAIDLTPSGGQSPYTFLWNPSGQTTEDRNSLSPNTYTVTVTDNHGCTVQASYAVTQPTVLSASMTRVNATCTSANGTATATPSGGTSPYSYVWTPGGQTTQTASGLLGGTYSCTVTDGHGCTVSNSIAVNTVACGPTKLSTGYCGMNAATLNLYIYCNSVSGATNYRYRFVCAAQGYNQTFVRGAALNNFLLTNATGLQYGRTYTVEVAAFVASVWTNYGPMCTINTLAFPTTKLSTTSCGITEATLDQQVYCNAIGGATNYEWKIVHAATSFSATYQRGNSSTDLRLTWISGITYGKTYTVQVRAYVGGVWGTFGPVCNLTTPATIPLTNVTTACGTTLAALSTAINCVVVPGATNYQWKVENISLSYSSTMNSGNSSTMWKLSWNVGTLLNTTYTVSVRAYAGGAWGNFGTVCNVTTGPIPIANEPDQLTDNSSGSNRIADGGDPVDVMYEMSIFPNPATDNVTVLIAGTKDNIIQVYNMIGEKVATATIEDGRADLNVSELPQGIFIVRALTDKGLVTGRLIK